MEPLNPIAGGMAGIEPLGVAAGWRGDPFALAFRHADVGLAVVAPNGAVREANPAFCHFLATEREPLLHCRLADVVHPEDQESHAASFGRLLAGEVTRYEREQRYVRGDGAVVWGQTTMTAVHAPEGHVDQAVCQVGSVPTPGSARRPAAGRRRTDAAAQQSARERVLSLVSHEIRTQLTSIQGYSELLTGVASDRDEVAELARVIHHEAVRLAATLDGMLLLDRLRSGALPIAPEPTDLNAAARETVGRFALARPERAVALDLHPALPLVQADRGRLQQAIGYLLANAAIRSPADAPITLRTRRQRGAVCVTVIDGGAPIVLAEPGAVFDRFELAELELVRAGGTGMELAIVREIAIRHGGRAWAEAGDGGCAFHLRLPSARRAA